MVRLHHDVPRSIGEMADTLRLERSAERHTGSTPVSSTIRVKCYGSTGRLGRSS